MTAPRWSASRLGQLADARFGKFFDWATIGPLSPAGVAARSAFLGRLDESCHPAARLRQEASVIEDTRTRLSRFLGATDTHRIVFGRSVSALCSLITTSLADTATQPAVVLTDTEHPVTRLCWSAVQQHRHDLRVIVVRPQDSGLVDLDAVAAAVDERCVAICAAHVARSSGVVQPVAALAHLAHRAGAVLLVDGAQAAGRVPVDLHLLNCDGYLGSGQKSLLAGNGIAFLAATSALLDRLQPLTWSSSNAELLGPQAASAVRLVDGPRRFEPEPLDLVGGHALHASVAQFLRVGMAYIRQHIADTTPVVADAMRGTGLPLRYRPLVNNAGILSYDTAGCAIEADALAGRLEAEGLVVESTGRLLRISVHLPNGRTEIAELAQAVRRCL